VVLDRGGHGFFQYLQLWWIAAWHFKCLSMVMSTSSCGHSLPSHALGLHHSCVAALFADTQMLNVFLYGLEGM
jgi:hypothetical protein